MAAFLFVSIAVVPTHSVQATNYDYIDHDTVWGPEAGVHILGQPVVVNAGVTLRIEPGTIIKAGIFGTLLVNGALIANGTSDNPITFTAYKDDSIAGDTNGDGNTGIPTIFDYWPGLRFYAGSSGELSHTLFRYGGNSRLSNEGDQDQIFAKDATLTLRDSKIFDSVYSGTQIEFLRSQVTLERNEIEQSSDVTGYGFGTGLLIRGGNAQIKDNLFHRNGAYAVLFDSHTQYGPATVVFQGNSLYNNGLSYANAFKVKYGIGCDGNDTYDLRNNWWGDATGTKVDANPQGKGEPIRNCDALVSPWLTVPPGLPQNGRRPVLLVPGIAGSELKKGNDKIWLDLTKILFDFNDSFLDVLAMNEDGTPTDPEVTHGDVIRTLNKGIPLISYDYFGGLIDELTTQGYQENTTMFLMPYDWREGMYPLSKELKQKLLDVKEQTHSDVVDVVAHSMGGVVVDNLTGYSPYDTGIGKLIFIGTPHIGAPKALKDLLWGDDLGVPFVLNKNEIKKIVQNMLSVYDLLPNKQYFKINSGYYYDLTQNSAPKVLNLTDMVALFIDKGLNLRGLQDVINAYYPHNFPFTDSNIDAYNISGCDSPTITGIIERPNEEYYLRIGAGDETVPLSSSNYVAPLVAKSYYIRGADHGKMASTPAVRSLVADLLTSGVPSVSELPAGITTSTDGCALQGKFVSVHSPVSLDIHDDSGNHAGPSANGLIENTIPGVYYETIRENKFVFLPSGTFDVTLTGTASGTVDLTVDTYSGELMHEVAYQAMPVTVGSLAQLTITPTSADTELQYDYTGSGQFQDYEATATSSTSAAYDFISPTTTAQLSDTAGNSSWYQEPVTMTLAASDSNSGVAKTEYRTDNGQWVSYTAPVIFNDDGVYRVFYRSTDRVGNVEDEQSVAFSIDRTVPDVSILFENGHEKPTVEGTDAISSAMVLEIGDNTYRVSDEAGNLVTLVFVLKVKKSGSKAKLNEVRYNGIALPVKPITFVNSTVYDKNDELKKIRQKIAVPKYLKVGSIYKGSLDETSITAKLYDEEKDKTVLGGIATVKLLISNGQFSYETD